MAYNKMELVPSDADRAIVRKIQDHYLAEHGYKKPLAQILREGIRRVAKSLDLEY